MPIKLVCRCGRNLIVPEERAGRLLECPKCRQRMVVPGERKPLPTEEPLAMQQVEAPIPIVAVATSPAPVVVAAPPVPPPLKRPAPPPLHAASAVVAASVPEPAAPPIPAPSVPVAPPPLVARAASPPPVPATVVPAIVPPTVPMAAPPEVPLQSPASAATTPIETAPAPPRRAGFQHAADKLSAAYLLATLVVVLGIIGMVPAVLEVVRVVTAPPGNSIGRFAYLLFFLGLMQFAYAFYLAQLPDWGSSWVLTVVILLQAALYMTLLTTIQLAQGQSPLVPLLDLHAHVDNGRVRAWSFIMLLLSVLVAYFCGSVSMRWQRGFAGLRSAYGR